MHPNSVKPVNWNYQSFMKKFSLLVTALLAFAFTRAGSADSLQIAPDTATIKTIATATDTAVNWLTLDEAMRLQKQNPKKIFVEVYATWCGWCRKMEGNFTNPVIATYINNNYYPVKLNAETRDALMFKGRSYKFINEGNFHVNELALFLLDYKQSYPGVVFLNEQGDKINCSNGYMDAIMVENLANYYGSNAYREMSFAQFEETFVGQVK